MGAPSPRVLTVCNYASIVLLILGFFIQNVVMTVIGAVTTVIGMGIWIALRIFGRVALVAASIFGVSILVFFAVILLFTPIRLIFGPIDRDPLPLLESPEPVSTSSFTPSISVWSTDVDGLCSSSSEGSSSSSFSYGDARIDQASGKSTPSGLDIVIGRIDFEVSEECRNLAGRRIWTAVPFIAVIVAAVYWIRKG